MVNCFNVCCERNSYGPNAIINSKNMDISGRLRVVRLDVSGALIFDFHSHLWTQHLAPAAKHKKHMFQHRSCKSTAGPVLREKRNLRQYGRMYHLNRKLFGRRQQKQTEIDRKTRRIKIPAATKHLRHVIQQRLGKQTQCHPDINQPERTES